MDEQYRIRTAALVAIGLREILKEIPVVGGVVSAYEAVFSEIEMDRVRGLLEELNRRVDNLTEILRDRRNLEILLFGCDQARSDILFQSKRRDYGGIVGCLIDGEAPLDDVVAILDSLRKLNSGDLRVLYSFRQGPSLSLTLSISALLPVDPVIRQHGIEEAIARRFSLVLPNLMRLQGLGLIFLTPSPPLTLPNIEIGTMTDQFRQDVHLTDVGKKLVMALPA